MPETNDKVSTLLWSAADLMELEGANKYRIRAYRKAAQEIASLDQNIEQFLQNGDDLTSISGVGEQLADKIKKIIETGHLPDIDELKNRLPPILGELLDLPEIRPDQVLRLYLELNINTMDDLKSALESGRVDKLPGFDASIRQELKHHFGGSNNR